MVFHRTNDRQSWAVLVAVGVLKPFLIPATSRDWRGSEHVPSTGGCILAVNHNSHFDTVTTAHFVYDHGRVPRFLAKQSLFAAPVVGSVLGNAGQIPVERLSRNAVGAFEAAVAAVNSGECVVVYPEGTLTRDPDLWPMTGKTGAARIALETQAPVIPVAQWGAQHVLAPYAKMPDFFPRKRVSMWAGPPVVLDDLYDKPRTSETFKIATDRIMDALTGILADIRGETPPAERYDPRKSGVRLTGDPRRDGTRD